MSLYVLILYDRDVVRRADVLEAADDGIACDIAHQTVQTRNDADGFELWLSGRRIAAYFANGGRSRRAPLLPPDDQQGGRHRRGYWTPQLG